VATFWTDFLALLRDNPLFLEGLLGLLLFVFAMLAFRRLRLIAEELERRKALGEYVRGLDEFLRGEYRPAIATLEQVLERDPENVEARIALGDCYRETGDAAEAKKHHHHVHRVFGHELVRNFVSLGEDELALRNYEQAVEAFENALRLSPRNADALAGMARAYAEGGSPVEAAGCLRRLYPHGPGAELGQKERRDAAKRFAEAGHVLLQDGDAEGAVRLYTEALAFEPTSVRARTGLVRAAHQLGDPERARRLVEEHVLELKRLAEEEDVLFEPAAPRTPEEASAPAAGPEGTASLLPARVEDVGLVVAEVERKTARYSCGQCGALLLAYADRCGACGAVGRVEPLAELSSLYLMPVADFQATVEEVEESAAFLQTLARRAATGDEEALRRLLGRGAASLYDVFAALPSIEGRRYLGVRFAELGAPAAREVRQCHAARGGGVNSGVRPHDEFAAAFYLALGGEDADAFLPSLGQAHDGAVAGAMCDPRLPEAVRDRALERLRGRGEAALYPAVEAAAATGDAGGIDRAAALVRALGDDAVTALERRYLQGTLLGRLLGGRRGTRRRATADILARSGVASAAEVLARAAAREKDASLRAYYLKARERAEGGPGK